MRSGIVGLELWNNDYMNITMTVFSEYNVKHDVPVYLL